MLEDFASESDANPFVVPAAAIVARPVREPVNATAEGKGAEALELQGAVADRVVPVEEQQVAAAARVAQDERAFDRAEEGLGSASQTKSGLVLCEMRSS